MNLTAKTDSAVDIVYLSGRFDAFEAPALATWLDQHSNVQHVVINLAGVSFIDSSGLAALVKGLKRCRQNNGDLYLCEMQQAVSIIFELTALHKAFAIFPDENAALLAFAAKQDAPKTP